MKMSKIIITAFFLFSITLLKAQSVHFVYDVSGNRTQRFIVYDKSVSALTDSTVIKGPLTDLLGDIKITLFPNPTLGSLSIEIAHMPDDAEGTIKIHNQEGKLLKQFDIESSSNQIDLSDYPNGIYILLINVGQKVSDWKIIKQ
jgi:hypothetical protein